jgi:polygalacturonase
MRKFVFIIAGFCLASFLSAQTDFGAVADDEKILNHGAINQAIIKCNQAGGGKVIVPRGTFHTGPVRLKSNVNLHLEEGAVLKFTTDQSWYYPAVLTRWEGIDCYNAHPLIYAYGETNIALTGKGVLDGQGSSRNWWYMKGGSYSIKGKPDQIKSGGRERLFAAAENNLPVEQRIMTPEDALRPPLVNFIHCNLVLIENLEIINSPFWVIHPMFCENLIVRGVNIQSKGPNSDGCDPESCRNVLIENCTFNTGDDCIAIKSGRNNDGRRWNTPSENIVVRNCNMIDGHGGVVIGSEISGGFRNLFVENCIMDSPNLDRALRIKTSKCRGGIIENIYFRNVKVGEVREAVVRINLVYEPDEKCDGNFPPTVRNVHVENVVSDKSRYGLLIFGLENETNVHDIHISNSVFKNVSSGGNRYVGKAEKIFLKNLTINSKTVNSDGKPE